MRIFVAAENDEEGDYCGRKPTEASAADVVVRKDNSHSSLSPLDSKYLSCRYVSRRMHLVWLQSSTIEETWKSTKRQIFEEFKNRCAPKLSSFGGLFGTEILETASITTTRASGRRKITSQRKSNREPHIDDGKKIYRSESNTFAAMASRTNECLVPWLQMPQWMIVLGVK